MPKSFINNMNRGQRLKQKVGSYSPEMTIIRQTAKGKLPTFLGLFGRKK